MTNENDPIISTVYRKTGNDSYRIATEKDIKEGIYLVYKEGLTKREYFAAMAMQGMAASNYWAENFTDKDGDLLMAMEVAVKAADVLIEALNKKG